jgi:iron complex transport system permease protein
MKDSTPVFYEKHMRNKRNLVTLLLIISPLIVLGISLFIGRYPKPLFMSIETLSNDALAQKLVFNLRLPRLLMAMFLGMSLSAAGGVMQMLFRNPLVEPGFLGVTQGAGFGAALSILLFSSSPLAIESSATFFAIVYLFLISSPAASVLAVGS